MRSSPSVVAELVLPARRLPGLRSISELPAVDAFIGPKSSAIETVLPRWWLAAFLAAAAIVLGYDLLTVRDRPSYSVPRQWETLPQSPPFFGAAMAFLGLWGVLFVGLTTVHRIVIVAPIFEEFLKFGLALLGASLCFRRSLRARYAMAVLVGVSFGAIEHAMTYPHEPDAALLFRVCFHSVTTGLTISLYTAFERAKRAKLVWFSPLLSILLHSVYNTFVVITSLLVVVDREGIVLGLQLSFGTVVSFVALLATIHTVRRHPLLLRFHEWAAAFI